MLKYIQSLSISPQPANSLLANGFIKKKKAPLKIVWKWPYVEFLKLFKFSHKN